MRKVILPLLLLMTASAPARAVNDPNRVTVPAAASIVGAAPFFSDVRVFNASYEHDDLRHGELPLLRGLLPGARTADRHRARAARVHGLQQHGGRCLRRAELGGRDRVRSHGRRNGRRSRRDEPPLLHRAHADRRHVHPGCRRLGGARRLVSGTDLQRWFGTGLSDQRRRLQRRRRRGDREVQRLR